MKTAEAICGVIIALFLTLGYAMVWNKTNLQYAEMADTKFFVLPTRKKIRNKNNYYLT